jgi:hypothetical protein
LLGDSPQHARENSFQVLLGMKNGENRRNATIMQKKLKRFDSDSDSMMFLMEF